MLAVILQLGDGFADVVQRQMLVVLLEARQDLRLPATRQFFQGRHIQVSVVKEGLQFWHIVGQKAAILADTVAAHG